MLDIQFVRDNPELVAEKSKQKGYDIDVTQLLGFDKERRELLQQVEELRQNRNSLSSETKGKKPNDEQIEQGRKLRDELGDLEHKLAAIEQEFTLLLKSVPNMPLDNVPIGASEDENQEIKKVGEPTKFDFEPKTHWEIGESKDWIDKKRAAKVTGARFAYLKGDIVKLQFAIIQFVMTNLSDSSFLDDVIKANNLKVSNKPFTPVLPPYFVRTEVYDAMDRLEPRDDRYKLDQDELWLQGSAEHVLGSMHLKEDILYEDLPLRYLGYATSFRREAGTYGKDSEGIFRMHQFDKLEMESITDGITGLEEHKFLIAIQERLMQKLGIPYRLLEKCTADIGKPNAKGVDIDAWLPGQNQYRETHTADYMTDYQARRLNLLCRQRTTIPEVNTDAAPIRVTSSSHVSLAHTNDATAFALGRTMIAIIENFQTKDGNVKIPEALQPYMGGRSEI
ncbi:MAG TPA: serine--tRNA ligase [Methylomirabilota bacterium]|nr:serine--tRNA ligase [Methylomirabilota bacterium]